MKRPHYIPTSIRVQVFVTPLENGPSVYITGVECQHMDKSEVSGWTLLTEVEVPIPDDPALFTRAHERLLQAYEAKRNDVRAAALKADQALCDAISNLQALPAPVGD